MKEVRDKTKKYSEYIRTNFKPTPDQTRIEERENRSLHILPKPKDSPKQIGLRYL